MSRLPAGSFNRKLELQQRPAGVDGTNQPVDNWEHVRYLRARPVGATGMSVIRSAEQGIAVGPGKYSWRIRYRPTGINEGMRVVYQGVIFDIIDVRHDYENHDWTDLVCETGGNRG